MLFWKIGSSSLKDRINFDLCFVAIIAVCIVYILSLISIKLFKLSSYQSGTFSQACYRFNTYLGMALIINTLGEPGAWNFGILAGFIIPTINALAVSTLIWQSGHDVLLKKIDFMVKALLSNPLIIGCAAGIIFSKFNLDGVVKSPIYCVVAFFQTLGILHVLPRI